MAGLRAKLAFKKYPEYSDAILALYPSGQAAFAIQYNEYSTLQWFNTELPKPSEEDIQNKLQELMEEYNKEVYKLERYKEYLTVEEQLNLLWDDMDAGIIPGKEESTWFSHVKEIKDKYPKSE